MTAIASPPTKQQTNPEDSISLPLITDQWISATWEEFSRFSKIPPMQNRAAITTKISLGK